MPDGDDTSAGAPPAFAWEHWYGEIGGRRPAAPELDALHRQIQEDQYPRMHGEPATTQRQFASPAEAAEHIKAKARALGADAVGICMLQPSDYYGGRPPTHTYAVALGKAMRYRSFQEVPAPASSLEGMRIYLELGEVCIELAKEIRGLGHDCAVEHPIGDSNILHVPIALRAGFGELGRHGSIIHPEIGPLFRLGSLLTSMPLAEDAPIDTGIAAFCDNCRACRIYCPADAIPDERDQTATCVPQGQHRYRIDTGRCFAHFARHHHCSACLPSCAYERRRWAHDRDGAPTKKFPTVRFDPPPTPVDGVAPSARHDYPRVNRDGFVAEWKVRARRHAQKRAGRVDAPPDEDDR